MLAVYFLVASPYFQVYKQFSTRVCWLLEWLLSTMKTMILKNMISADKDNDDN